MKDVGKMKTFNEICQDKRADGRTYEIKSNLINVSKSKTNNEENNKWLAMYGKDLDRIAMIDVDELKEWYCANYTSMTPGKSSGKQLHSCDALYISPQSGKMHYLIEFKNQSRLEYGNDEICQNINMKVFDSRQLLYDVFGKRFLPDEVKEQVKLYIVYNYEQSAKENEQKVTEISNKIRKRSKKRDLPKESKPNPREQAKSNIKRIIEQQGEFFEEVQFMNAENFLASFVPMAKKAPCNMG